jgi:hypothetical protein
VLIVEAIAELLKKFESASPPIAKPANPQTISNDGLNSGDARQRHLRDKHGKTRLNVLRTTKLDRGKPLNAPKGTQKPALSTWQPEIHVIRSFFVNRS